jgi:hypothetical protein
MILAYPSPPAIAADVFDATRTLEKKLAFVSSFPNVADVSAEGNDIAFRGTETAAASVAAGGFDVFRVWGALFLARRRRGLRIEGRTA